MKKRQLLLSLLAIFFLGCENNPVALPIETASTKNIEEHIPQSIISVDTLFKLATNKKRIGDPGLVFRTSENYNIVYMGAALLRRFDLKGTFLDEIELINSQVGMSNPAQILNWGNGFAVLDLSDLNFCLYNQEWKFREQRYFNFKTQDAGSILESAAINPIRLSEETLLLPVQPPGESFYYSSYYLRAHPLAIFDTTGMIVRAFGEYPSIYSDGKIYCSFIAPHFAITSKNIYVGYEASPEIQVYDHQGNFKLKFGTSNPNIRIGSIPEAKQPTYEQYIEMLDSSTYYFQLFVSPINQTTFRFILDQAPKEISRAQRFERTKYAQVYDNNGFLSRTITLPKEVVSIIGFDTNDEPLFLGYLASKDTYFISKIQWNTSHN